QLALTLPNSREGESEADAVGTQLAAHAGYDPKAAAALWDKMAKLGGAPPEFLSTHPSPEHRKERLEQLGQQVEPLYVAAREGRPTEAEVMTFRSVPFNQFKTGTASFTCRLECAFSYNNKKAGWKKLHEQQNWRELALSVMSVGYLGDLSYFMLAESAKGLGLADTAKVYYQRALQAGKEYGCAGGLSNTCEGFEVQKLASAALSRR
ncbi:MAG TPA: M48 family metalloprotease, partial [Steroidobacteraceae bacterium]